MYIEIILSNSCAVYVRFRSIFQYFIRNLSRGIVKASGGEFEVVPQWGRKYHGFICSVIALKNLIMILGDFIICRIP